MPFLTILTATYNRATLLTRVYASLLRQTSCDFEWLIVDDGSTDETEPLVQKWILDSMLSIRYLKKINGGKHTAINVGVQKITSTLTFILDSDDWIAESAVERIRYYSNKYCNFPQPICGFTFHRQTSNKINGGQFPRDEQVEFYPEFHVNTWHGDTAQVFYTDILRKFPFPEFPGELKCVSEDIVWIPMGLEYATVFIREILTFSEYQPDGLTKNLRARQNYLSQYYRGHLYMHPRISLKYRLRGALMVNVYAKFCHIKVDDNILTRLMYIPGHIIYWMWSLKYGMKDAPQALTNGNV